MKFRRLSSLLLILAFAAISIPEGSAHTLNRKALRQQLAHNVFLLRGRYACPRPGPCTLDFNRSGQIQSATVIAPFSLGNIYVDHIKFSKHWLELNGYGATLLRISNDKPIHFKALVLHHERLKLRIAFDASHPSELQKALNAIFAGNIYQTLNAEPPGERKANLESLPLLAPEPTAKVPHWLRKGNHPEIRGVVLGKNLVPGKNGVKPPKVVYMITPRYTDQATRNRIQGFCMFQLVVNAQGFPQSIRILKSLPDGLEEQAFSAVSQYRFLPATLNGKPVPIRMLVEVSFHLGE